MVRAATAAFTALFLSAGYAQAQDLLKVGQSVEAAITAGSAREYTIALDAGDYVAGAVDQRACRYRQRTSAQPIGARVRWRRTTTERAD